MPLCYEAKAGKHLPGTYSCSCSCQGVQRSTNKRQTKAIIENENGTINSNKQIKQSNRSGKQTKSPRKAFTLLLLLLLHFSRRRDKQCSNKQAANGSENRKWAKNSNKQIKQSNRSSNQTKSSSGRFHLALVHENVLGGFLLKRIASSVASKNS
jgi:hypothetical protein